MFDFHPTATAKNIIMTSTFHNNFPTFHGSLNQFRNNLLGLLFYVSIIIETNVFPAKIAPIDKLTLSKILIIANPICES